MTDKDKTGKSSGDEMIFEEIKMIEKNYNIVLLKVKTITDQKRLILLLTK